MNRRMLARQIKRPGGGVFTPVHPQANPRGSLIVAALRHFAIVALSVAIAVYLIGVLSVLAYVLWASGWDLGLRLLEVLS